MGSKNIFVISKKDVQSIALKKFEKTEYRRIRTN